MPLKRGSSKRVISSNIAAELRAYKKSGAIGTSKPRSMKAATRQAVAIAMAKAGKSRKKK